MKNIKSLVALLVIIIGGTIYVSETYLDIDLVGYIIPDTKEPILDTSSIRTTVTLDGLFDTSKVTCEDNKDDSCDVEVIGIVDTSIVGSQTITFQATDKAGNISKETFIIQIIEGINTAMYVPLGYYDSATSLTGEALKDALNDIITGHTEFPYTDKDLDDMDVWKMLRAGDEDPENSENVIMFYSEFSWSKECQDTNTDLLPDYCFENNDREANYLEWNREHIWSKSHGDFEDEDGYEFEDSFGGYALGAHTDGHHLVAAERTMNSTKNNRFFDDCHDGINDDNLVDREYGNYTCGEWFFEPRDEVKGDVARMLFYMATRYEGEDGDYVDLELTADFDSIELIEQIQSSKLPYYADLAVLLRWHMEDPVDEWEIERNESIYHNQGNRNPFIDMPELVSLVWGTPENPIEYISITAE
jgi:endonuclease I